MLQKLNTLYFFDIFIHYGLSDDCISDKLEDLEIFLNEDKYIMNEISNDLNVKIHQYTRIKSIDTETKTINVLNTQTNTEQNIEYDHIIINSLAYTSISWCIVGLDYSIVLPSKLYNQIQQQFQRIILLEQCDNQTLQRMIYNSKSIAIVGSSIKNLEIAQVLVYYNKNVHLFEKELTILGNQFHEDYAQFFQDQYGQSHIVFHTMARIVKIQELPTHVVISYQQQVFNKTQINEQIFDLILLGSNLSQINVQTNSQLYSQELQLLDEQQAKTLLNDKKTHIITNIFYVSGEIKNFATISQHQPFYSIIKLFTKISGISIQNTLRINKYPICYRSIAFEKFNVHGIGLPTDCYDEQSIKELSYSDYVYQDHASPVSVRAVQAREVCEEFAVRLGEVRKLVDDTIESSNYDFAHEDDNVAGVTLTLSEVGQLLGGGAMGVLNCEHNTDIISLAIAVENDIKDLLSMDFGGIDGINKPWNVLQLAAAQFAIKLCDFEGIDATDDII